MRFGWVAAVLTSGCSEWPRFANLEDAPAYADPADVAHAEVDWGTPSAESVDFGDHLRADDLSDAVAVTPGHAGLVAGVIIGAGWSDTTLKEGTPSPEPSGWYAFDADFFLLDLPDAAYLCARAEFLSLDGADPTGIGWDLSLYQVDGADPLTGTLVLDGERPLGANQGNPIGGWGVNVEPGLYAVSIGVFTPEPNGSDDAQATLAYQAGLAAYAPFDGSSNGCPLLPGESQ